MSMMDFAVLPPEVNSGRMYAGAGSGPMMAVAATWGRLAAQLSAAAGSYQTVIWELTDGPWRGPASASMAAAAKPYVEWMHTTAARAEQTADRARAAAAAYEQAFAAIVPPSVVAANRAALTSLMATNTFGQNTAAIAANQAEYAEMWAQDVAAMHDYAAGSAAAATLPPFAAPPQSTDPAGAGTQAGAVAQNTAPAAAATIPASLENLLNSNPLVDFLNGPLIQGLEQINQQVSGFTSFTAAQGLATAGILLGGPDFPVQGAIAAAQVYAAVTAGTPELASSVSGSAPGSTLAGSYGPGVGAPGAAGPAGAGVSAGGVSAGLGRATPLGELSVPPSWGAALEGIRLATTAWPTSGYAGLAALPEAGMAAPSGWLGGIPPVGSVVNAPRHGESRVRAGSGFTQVAGEAGAGEGMHGGRALGTGIRGGLSERDELNRVREAVAELRKTREALKRSAAEMIREARRR